MSEGEESEAVVTCSCCASCGIAEIDDIKLKDCDDCDLVKLNTAAMNVGKIIKQSTKKNANNGLLNYVMNYYSSNQKARTWGTAQSAVYLFLLRCQNLP